MRILDLTTDTHKTENPRRFPRSALAAALGLLLAACDPAPTGDESADSADVATTAAAAQPAGFAGEAPSAAQRLAAVLAAQPADIRERYEARHPQETLLFLGIEPGMTVAEADPGGGWYSKILQSYLGAEGMLIGADYPMGVYRLFNYYSDEELAAKASWAERWPVEVAAGVTDGAALKAYTIGSMPASMAASVDVFLLIRALHNLADFEEEGGYLTGGLNEVFRALKPGGVVGVVQHSGPESHSDAWASGGNGYLKKSFVISAMEAAGFVYEDESSVNENPRDQPGEDESVWRLAPTLEAVEDPELAAAYAAIGESNRMTLRFRKPKA